MKRATVIIPDADAELSLKVIRCLGPSRMFKTVLVSASAANPALRSRYCSKGLMFSGKQDSQLLQLLDKQGESIIDGIILPVTLSGFRFVSANHGLLSRTFRPVPLPTLEAIDTASDKWRLFELARNHGLPVLPSHSVCHEVIEEILQGRSDISLPVLVKSRNRRGGFGFQRISSVTELEHFGAAMRPDAEEEYIVQPFIDGQDYSLSVYCENGYIKAYTLWQAVVYGGRQYSIPRIMRFVEHNAILSTGKKLMACLNWQGVCDIDFFVDKRNGSFWLLEVNARFWQTVVAALAAGVNFPYLLCKAAQGFRPAKWPSQRAGFYYSRPSGVPSLLGLPAARPRGLGEFLRNTGVGEIVHDPLPEITAALSRLRFAGAVHSNVAH